jgi:hypothetical protein
VGDAVEPRAQRDVALLARQRTQRGRHRRLQRVLGVLAIAHDRQAVAVELLVVLLEDRREGGLVAACGTASQPG